MGDQYRVFDRELDEELGAAERQLKSAWDEAQAAYPSGADCVVRTKRWGHAATERVAKIVGANVSVFFFDGAAHVSVTVNTVNIKTGKRRTYYPSLEVDGIPSIRLKDDQTDSQAVGNG